MHATQVVACAPGRAQSNGRATGLSCRRLRKCLPIPSILRAEACAYCAIDFSSAKSDVIARTVIWCRFEGAPNIGAVITRFSYAAWFGIVLSACSSDSAAVSAVQVFATPFSSAEAPATEDSPVASLPASVELDPRKVALGRRLYTDKRMSGDGKVSCNDCHDLQKGGSNGIARSALPDRPPVAVNVPTVFNAAFNFRFAWNGRFRDIAEQIDTALGLKAAMNSNWEAAAKAIGDDAQYLHDFQAIYPEGLTDQTLREAISVYTLSLVTPNARFDRHLRGELQLTAEESRGWELFREYGCVSCHQGINIGGNMVQKLGIVRDYFRDRGNVEPADYGLFNSTGREDDRYVFRVPSLRNVALTAPYFHDGSVAELEDAVAVMARYQLGRTLAPSEIAAIASFLRSLTGELDGASLALAGRTSP